MRARPVWNAHFTGVILGLVLLLTFVATGHGLGASGAPTAVAAVASNALAPAATANNDYLGGMVADGANPLTNWISWEVLGVLAGALLAAVLSGHFRMRVEGPDKFGSMTRLALALVAGVISGFGARISVGCTSGLGLSGAATLATAGFVFLIGFFVIGAVFGLLTKGWWK
jgi:uncharacterized membrane protein YedE/YeeE